MLVGTLLPIIAVTTGRPWMRVSYIEFLCHTLPLLGLTLAIIAFLHYHRWLRPNNSPVFSWEAALFQVVRWPWSAYGSLMGVVMAFRQRTVEFKVTPKGSNAPRSLSWKILGPYIAIILLTFAPTLWARSSEADGYHYFLILSQITYWLALISLFLAHYHDTSKASG